MKLNKSTSLLNKSLLFSQICIGSSVILKDPSHFHAIKGHRKSFFSLIDPAVLKYSLKTTFLFLESVLKKKYKLIFVTKNIDPLLFIKFSYVCLKQNHFVLKDSEISGGFLDNANLDNVIFITLFLDQKKVNFLQKETFSKNIPLISFGDLSSNKNSNALYVGGNFDSFLSQSLILNLLINCLLQKNGNS
jgi:hypothetical protein|tara:strand:- start:789 stop:1358 length:570 start_codon:yes stop_codon:yes gene_type:complete